MTSPANPFSEILDPWNSGSRMEALLRAWAWPDSSSSVYLNLRDAGGPTLYELVSRACHAAARADAAVAVAWADKLLKTPPPELLSFRDMDSRRHAYHAPTRPDFRLHRVMRTMVGAARAIATGGQFTSNTIPQATLEALAKDSGLPVGFVLSLMVPLWSDRLADLGIQRDGQPLHLQGLFVSGEGTQRHGLVGLLHLERLAGGSGAVFPAAETALVFRDADFVEAENHVQQFIAHWLPAGRRQFDVRWRLTMLDGRPITGLLTGPSLGGALALGASQAFLQDSANDRDALWQALASGGIAVTAAINAKGEFGPVGGVITKLIEAARAKSFPCIHTVLLASDHQPAKLSENAPAASPAPKPEQIPLAGLEAVPLLRDAFRYQGSELQLHFVADFESACRSLRNSEQRRWPGLRQFLAPPDPDYVERGRLREEIERRTGDPSRASGHLVMVGDMGRGKTTFLRETIHHLRARGRQPVSFFIRYQGNAASSEAVTESLHFQLCRKYGLPPERRMVANTALDWRQTLTETLQKVSERLSEANAAATAAAAAARTAPPAPLREVIYIDAADQLDPGNRLVESVLYEELPTGIFTVISTRANQEWNERMSRLPAIEFLDFADDRVDVHEFLKRVNPRFRQPLSDALLHDICFREHTPPGAGRVEPPVFFTVARLVKRLAAFETGRTAGEDPLEAVERGFTEAGLRGDFTLWLTPPETLVSDDYQRFERLVEARGKDLAEAATLLGIIAVAREELTRAMLAGLGLWRPATSETVLRLAADFFTPDLRTSDARQPLRFYHPGYSREILRRVTQRLGDEVPCHRALAEACARVWAERGNAAQDYALRHGAFHLCAGREAQRAANLLVNMDYLRHRLGAAQEDGPPPDGPDHVIDDLDRALLALP